MNVYICVHKGIYVCNFFANMHKISSALFCNIILFLQIDTKKMPLGKLSKKQIERAYRVLSEALDLLGKMEKKPPADGEGASGSTNAAINAQLLDCSNRFYTLIPHDFGMKKPPLLNDLELIKVLFC